MRFLIIASSLLFAAASYDSQNYREHLHEIAGDKINHKAKFENLHHVTTVKSAIGDSQENQSIYHKSFNDSEIFIESKHSPIFRKFGVQFDTKGVLNTRAKKIHKGHIKTKINKQKSSEEYSDSNESSASRDISFSSEEFYEHLLSKMSKNGSGKENSSSNESSRDVSVSSEEYQESLYSSEEEDSSEELYKQRYITKTRKSSSDISQP